MHNQRSNQRNQNLRNDFEELYERLGTPHRLRATDKPIFARNLGELAARLSPDDPVEGARRIVMHSGYDSLWPTKRKKFFRLPGEDAPPAGKNGDYASYPVQFRQLAEAAGELLCNSDRPEAVENWKKIAVKNLATGSSFMPSFIPAGISGQSAKELLDEYAAVLADAVKSRTKITELWEVLQSTPIGLEIGQDDPSPYGEAARFPHSLLTPMYRDGVKSGQLTTTSAWTDDDWSKPTLAIGCVSFPVKVRMFCIPEEKRHLFPRNPMADRELSREGSEWLQSVGFDFEKMSFPPIDWGDGSFGWQAVNANIFLEVGLSITHYGDAEPKVEIQLWGDLNYAVHPDQQVLRSNVAELVSNSKMSQHWGLEVIDLEFVEVVYDKPFSNLEDQEAAAIGILPSCWQLGSDGVEWKAPTVWLDQASSDLCDEIYANNYARGWTDDEFIAKLLMSEETEFYPTLPDADPTGGVLPSGSVGASLLQNARMASSSNRITQLLIDKVALTAETGLRFYEAMVNDYRSAIHRI